MQGVPTRPLRRRANDLRVGETDLLQVRGRKQRGKCRPGGRPHQVDEEADPISSLLVGGTEDRHESSQRESAVVTAVSTRDLAIDDGRTDALFGWPVRGFESVDSQEGEEEIAIAVEMVAKKPVGFVGRGAVEKVISPCLELADDAEQPVRGDEGSIAPVAQRERVEEERLDGAREVHRSTRGHPQQLIAAAKQMRQAGLIDRKSVV